MTGPIARVVRGRELLLAAVALFLLLSLAYVFSIGIRATRGASITGDEPFYLLTTQSLIADRDLDLRNQYTDRSYRSFFDHADELWRQSVPTSDGPLLSPHNPGLSLLVAPGFLLGGLVGVQVQLMLAAAGAMALAFVLADRLTCRRAVSWAMALGVGLTATAFIYSTEVYPEFPAALALVLALLIATGRRQPSWPDALYLAAALSAMCWLGIKYAPLAVLVSSYFLLRSDRTGRIALVAAGSASAGFFAWFHLQVFGSLTPYGVNVVYANWNTLQILEGHFGFEERIYRLWGLFIDRRFGIGRWAPLLLAVVPGLVLLAWRTAADRLVLGLMLIQLFDSHLRGDYDDGLVVPGPHHADGATAVGRAAGVARRPRAGLGQDRPSAVGRLHVGDYCRARAGRTRRRDHHRGRSVRHAPSALSKCGVPLPAVHLVDSRDVASDHLVAGGRCGLGSAGRLARNCGGSEDIAEGLSEPSSQRLQAGVDSRGFGDPPFT